MAADPTGKSSTFEEYLALEQGSAVKHEFVHGRIYAMAGGTLNHDRVANTVRALLRGQPLPDGCEVFGPDLLVRVAPSVAYYPDAFVLCDAGTLDDDLREVSTPRVIVEVLSDSMESNDRGGKWINYQTLATLREYVLVSSRDQAVERFRRDDGDLWLYQRYGPGDVVALESIGVSLPVAALYRRGAAEG